MIFVEGGRSKQRSLTYKLVSFAWMQLMPRITKCDLNVTLKNMKVYHGTCLDIDNREFQIDIDRKLKGDDFITTVFHEMVHVKQIIRGELWTECNFYKTHEEYMSQPHEIEAYHMQEVLLERWRNRNVKEKV